VLSRSQLAAASITSASSAGLAEPMASMSNWKNWRYRPFCGRS
jgi:hypothetical protein